jgi:hypothetical protein
MDFLRTLDLRRCRLLEWSIHIGSDDGVKGPPKHHNSRDFAAVMAQISANRRVFGILSTYSIKYT